MSLYRNDLKDFFPHFKNPILRYLQLQCPNQERENRQTIVIEYI